METNELWERLFSLQGRCALITGASGGIGQALAIMLAEAGAHVCLSGTNEEALRRVQVQIQEQGGMATVQIADLRETEVCHTLIERAVQSMGRLDILINNAGMNRRKPLLEATAEDFDTLMAVNLRSALLLSQAAYAPLRAQGGGKIVNIGSMTSFLGLGHIGVYGTTKAGLAQLTKTMAVEWAADNIQVNCLAPGFIRTPLTEAGVWNDPHRTEWLLERIPSRRPGLPEDLLGATLLLCSPASNYITGQVLAVDGGFLAGGSW